MRRQGAATTNARNSPIKTVSESEALDRPETLEDAVQWASWAVWAVTTGKIDGRTAHEIGYVLRAFVDGRKHLDKVDSRVRELAEKLRKLREAAE